MNCDNTRALLHGYLDSELDLGSSINVEGHLAGCEDCAREYEGLRKLRAVIRAEAPYFALTPALQQRIRLSLPLPPKAVSPVAVPRRRWLVGGLAWACSLLFAFALARSWFTPIAEDRLTHEVLASHLRSLMEAHLADVASSDQHTVKPWFDGRLDFSPPVTDFASQGFPLVGGRLDYINSRSVAALVYRRRQHVINLFIWPTADRPPTPISVTTQQGYQLFHWSKDGMIYWATSDLSPSELQAFVLLVQN